MSVARAIHNLALIGFMGTGKSTVGQLVADHLSLRFVDTDDEIERVTGRSISAIFAADGEARFREMETAVVRGLENQRGLVIATGGGLVTRPENLASLRSHALVICLWATPEAVYARVRHQTHRPLLQTADPLARIRELLAEREPFYRAADVLLSTDPRSSKEVAGLVAQQFRLALAGPVSQP